MSHLLVLDPEQADIVETALRAADGFLTARARRIDPDDVIKKSQQMTKIKVQHLLNQMRSPPLPSWKAMRDETRQQIIGLLRAIVDEPDAKSAETLWETLIALAMSTREQTPAEAGRSSDK